MEVKFINGTANIEGLTYRQLALIELAILKALESGGYSIDIEDYQDIMTDFKKINIKDVFDLEEEKRRIEENVNRIMREAKIETFRERFSLIHQCKDDEVRTLKCRDLMTLMEMHFKIPMLVDEEYNKNNSAVMELYLEISNARIL